jgi:flagellar motility protein MotE (MotC chaperone)
MSETRPSKELLNALDQIEKMNHPKLKQFLAPSMDDLKKELSALRAENERLKEEINISNENFKSLSEAFGQVLIKYAPHLAYRLAEQFKKEALKGGK